MIAHSRLAKAAVLGCTAAAICSLLPPAASASAAQATAVARTSAVAHVPAVATSSSGALVGTVRALGGPGLAGICVSAAGPTGTVHAVTAAGGRYSLIGLRPGQYRVGFVACSQPGRYVGQWYGGAPTAGGARWVLVTPGHPTFLRPVTLRPVSAAAFLAASARAMRAKLKAQGRPAAGRPPQLSGTIASSAGKRLAGICVVALRVSTDGLLEDELVATTGKNGTYKVPPGFLDKGNWKINFSTGCGNKGNFAPQWWKGAATQSKATILHFGKNSHYASIGARLVTGASISGIVRAGSKSGPVLPGACVQGFPEGGMSAVPIFTKTGANGKYLITGLGTGRYDLQFGPGCGSKGKFTPSKNISVSVKDGKDTTVDSFLPRPGGLSGTVTAGPHHRAVPGICVEADSRENSFDVHTGPAGRYAFADLPAGRYEVAFFAGCGDKGSFAPQFYQGQVSPVAADSVLVRAGKHVGGINAVMRPGGIVTGTVTDSAGKKLTGVCVVLTNQADQGAFRLISVTFSAQGGDSEAQAQTSVDSQAFPFGAIGVTASGRYRVTDLPPGNYSATFSTGCKRHQPTDATAWFSPQGNDATSLVTVGTGTTSGVDAKLPAPGTITGVITDASGKPVAGVCTIPVGLHGEPDSSLAELVNNADTPESNRQGVYRITGLAAGKYGVEFLPCTTSKPFATEWYRHSGGFAGLTPVVVKGGQVTAGIDGQVVTGQSISGRITSAGTRQPVARACVFVSDTSGNGLGLGVTKKNGAYSVPNLAPGSYNLQVGPCAGSALANVLRTRVNVTSSKPTAGVDVALPASGRMAGLVTGGSPARAVGGGCVIATPRSGPGAVRQAFTASDGKYSLGGLAPGRYRVEFSTLCPFSTGGFASQWFDNKATSAKATPVGVSSGKTTAGIDGRLAAAGEISGSVKVGSSARAGVCVLAFRKSGGTTPTVGVTGANGRFLIGGLASGRYVVEFTGGCGATSYHTQWFDRASSRSRATPVVVKAGSVTIGINAR